MLKIIRSRYQGADMNEREILDYCKEHLASFKRPKSVDFFDSLPKGGTGKILKKILREKYWADHRKRGQG